MLGRSVDEFDFELLCHPSLGAREESLAEDNWSLAGTDDTTLDQDEIFVDLTIVREATHGSNVLFDSIVLAHSVVSSTIGSTGTHAVDLLVDIGTGVITLLTTSSNRPLNCGRMPGTDTGDFAET